MGHFLGYFYISEPGPVWVSWSDVCEWRAENYLLSLPEPVTPTPSLRQTNNSKANVAKHSLWIKMEIAEVPTVQKSSNYGKIEAQIKKQIELSQAIGSCVIFQYHCALFVS